MDKFHKAAGGGFMHAGKKSNVAVYLLFLFLEGVMIRSWKIS